jgi:hypothetical protein
MSLGLGFGLALGLGLESPAAPEEGHGRSGARAASAATLGRADPGADPAAAGRAGPADQEYCYAGPRTTRTQRVNLNARTVGAAGDLLCTGASQPEDGHGSTGAPWNRVALTVRARCSRPGRRPGA